MKILCIIPARSGSKSLPHKNIKNFHGKPLLVWSIEQAKKSKYTMRIIVSTDCEKYAKIAKEYGAETPFLRPKKISEDNSTDYECISHCVEWLYKNENYQSDIIIHLRPTQPCRKIEDIDNCLDIFIKNIDNYDSLRSVVEFEKSPYKMYSINTIHNHLKPLFHNINTIQEPYNQCRQVLPKTYLHNGYIDILKSSILENGTISGNTIYPYIMNKEDIIDIDTKEDWVKANNKNV
jgi:CMP-N,N'-diacetyllegionaminic acid synthase